MSVTVLGGGYALSIDGNPRILVDVGSGTLDGLGQSNFEISRFEQVLLTRLDIDRTGDLPDLVLRMYANGRRDEVALTGPVGRPGAVEFVGLLFGPNGAWRYVNEIETFAINVMETPSAASELSVYTIPVSSILNELRLSIYAVAVPNVLTPSVAYRIDRDDASIVFCGDLKETTPSFLALARNCSLLVHDAAAKQSAVEKLALECGAKAILL